MFNWIKNKWNYNNFIQHFSFIKVILWNAKKIDNKLFDSISKNIDNLELDLATEKLDSIKEDFEYFSEKQKSNYYVYKSRVEEFKNLFKEKVKTNNRWYCENLVKTSNYLENDNTLLNKAIWLHWLWDIEESKQIIEDLIKKWKFNEYVYWFYLMIKKDEYDNFEDFVKIIDKKYKDNFYIQGILWNIYKIMWWSHIEAFERFYQQDYKEIKKFYEKIIYFRIWAQYLESKYSINNLSDEWKEKYLEFEKYIDSFIGEFEWKKLFAEIDVLNQKAMINAKVKLLPKKADYFFNKAFEKNNSWIIRVNRVLNLLNIEKNDDKEIYDELEDIINNLNFYLEQEKWNPNKSILYQVFIISRCDTALRPLNYTIKS